MSEAHSNLQEQLSQNLLLIKDIKLDSINTGDNEIPALFVYTNEQHIRKLESACTEIAEHNLFDKKINLQDTFVIVYIAEHNENVEEYIINTKTVFFIPAVIVDLKHKTVGKTYLCPKCHSTKFKIIFESDNEFCNSISELDYIGMEVEYKYDMATGKTNTKVTDVTISKTTITVCPCIIKCLVCGYEHCEAYDEPYCKNAHVHLAVIDYNIPHIP